MRSVFFIVFFICNSLVSLADTPPVHPFLYRVEVKGTVSYLVGTLHSTQLSMESFDHSLLRALLSAEVLMIEPELYEPGTKRPSHKDQSLTLSNPIYPNISSGAQNRLKAFVNKYGLIYASKTDRIAFLKSMTAGAIIRLVLEVSTHHYSSSETVPGEKDVMILDERILAEARKQGLQVRGLDSPAVNASVFEASAPSASEFNRLILDVLKSNGELTPTGLKWISETAHVMDHWNNRTPEDALRDYMAGKQMEVRLPPPSTSSIDKFSRAHFVALVDRHSGWVDTIFSSMSSKPTFVAVGVSHVTGFVDSFGQTTDTLLNLLRAKGAKVTQIEVPNQVPQISSPSRMKGRALRCSLFL